MKTSLSRSPTTSTPLSASPLPAAITASRVQPPSVAASKLVSNYKYIILVVHSIVSLSGDWSFFPFLRDVPSPSPCNGPFFPSFASSSFSVTRSFLLAVVSCRKAVSSHRDRPMVPSLFQPYSSSFRSLEYLVALSVHSLSLLPSLLNCLVKLATAPRWKERLERCV